MAEPTISPSFVYSPLSASSKEIRLLHLQPTPNSGCEPEEDISPLQATITTISLLDTPSPAFNALSYVWGPEPSADSPTHHLHINGQPIPIRSNLYQCLMHLRRSKTWALDSEAESDKFNEALPLWIDAICINQSDIPERNSQVLLMGDVYRSASSVVSWLGSDQWRIDGLTKLQEIADRWYQEVVNFQGMTIDNLYADTPEEIRRWLRDTSEEFWQDKDKLWCLVAFFESEYWSRVWIVQEVMLANPRSHVYVCGDEVVFADSVDQFVRCMYMIFGTMGDKPEAVDWEVWMLLKWRLLPHVEVMISLWAVTRGFAKPSLMFVLRMAASRTSTDPRDAVYGLLNIIPDHGIVPDYGKPVAEVYVDWAVRTMKSVGNLDLIADSFNCSLTPCKHLENFALPSWVPDLHHHRGSSSGELFWTPKEKSDPPAGFSVDVVDGKILKTNGWIFDRVTNVTRIASRRDGEKAAQNWKQDLFRFCIDYLKEQRSRQRLYPTGIPPLQALFFLVLGPKIAQLELDKDSKEIHVLACQFIRYLIDVFVTTIGAEAGWPYAEAYLIAASDLGFTAKCDDCAFSEQFQRAMFPGVDVRELYGWHSLLHATFEVAQEQRDMHQIAYTISDLWKAGMVVIEAEQGYLGEETHNLPNVEVGDPIMAIYHCRSMLHMRQCADGFTVLGGVRIIDLDPKAYKESWVQSKTGEQSDILIV